MHGGSLSKGKALISATWNPVMFLAPRSSECKASHTLGHLGPVSTAAVSISFKLS